MALTIDLAALAEQLPDLLERVQRDQERFIIERDGKPVATLAPPAEPAGATADEISNALRDLRMPEPDYADDLEQIHAAQPKAHFPEWRS